jgi:phage baseplate assembly protein W
MLASGNSKVAVCVNNLLKTYQDEVPYRRMKGLPHDTVDLPADEIEQQMIEDAELCLDDFEPRIDIDDILLDTINNNGDFTYTVNITPTEEELEEED